VVGGTVVDHLQERRGRRATHLGHRLAHRRQRRRRGRGQRDVVETDDRDVVGDPPAPLAQLLQRAERHEVVGDGGTVEVRRGVEQRAHRLAAALDREVGVGDGRGGEAECGELGAEAVEPVDGGRHVQRTGHGGDPHAPGVGEQAGGGAGAAVVVGVDVPDGRGGVALRAERAALQHHRRSTSEKNGSAKNRSSCSATTKAIVSLRRVIRVRAARLVDRGQLGRRRGRAR
jgi:hypothetical protein